MGDVLPWKARPWVPALLALALSVLVESFLPRLYLDLPRGGGAVSMALGHLVPAPLAVALVGVTARTWCSPGRTDREERWERRVLMALVASSCLALVGAVVGRIGWEGALALGRGLLTWVALTLMSRRFLGDRRAWVVPMMVLALIVTVLGESVSTLTWISDDLRGRWPWLTAIVVWMLAAAGAWATPWRLFLLRSRIGLMASRQ